MINTRIQIEDGPIWDIFKHYGFIYIESDNRTAPPEKESDTISYPEKAGEYTNPNTVYATFDYTAKFIVECPNGKLDNANVRIKAFNDDIRETHYNSDILTKRRITFYNDYKRVSITGYPELIAELTELYRRQDGSVMDCAEFELKIHVDDPTLCNFSTTGEATLTYQLESSTYLNSNVVSAPRIQWLFNNDIQIDNVSGKLYSQLDGYLKLTRNVIFTIALPAGQTARTLRITGRSTEINSSISLRAVNGHIFEDDVYPFLGNRYTSYEIPLSPYGESNIVTVMFAGDGQMLAKFQVIATTDAEVWPSES